MSLKDTINEDLKNAMKAGEAARLETLRSIRAEILKMDKSGMNREMTPEEEIALLTLLIEKWDEEHNIFNDLDPIEILKSLMKDHKMKSYQLAQLLNVSEGLISDMLNYKKGLSKETIRILSTHFKLSQEAFNKAYKLKLSSNSPSAIINTKRAIKMR